MSTSASVTVDELTPISLAGLDVIAALHVRNDRKYVVDQATVDFLLGDLAADLRVLQIDGLRKIGRAHV